jgi:hypothetical protein
MQTSLDGKQQENSGVCDRRLVSTRRSSVQPLHMAAVCNRGHVETTLTRQIVTRNAAHNSFPHRRVQLTADACYCSGSASGSCCSMARRAWSRIRLPTTRVKMTLMTKPAITTPPAMSPIIARPSGLFRTTPLR